MRARVGRLESRLNALLARPGFAGQRGRLAMRGRHAAELSSALRRAMTASIARRARRHEHTQRALTQFDPRHRLGAVRTRLVARDGHLGRTMARRLQWPTRAFARWRHGSTASARSRCSPAAMPSAGTTSRTRILRDADERGSLAIDVRVTLERGELRCAVTETTQRRLGQARS